jgi:hypothetical protein
LQKNDKVLWWENSVFLPFLFGFLFTIAVSPLGVPMYTSRGSADDFCTKSVCPRASVFGHNLKKAIRFHVKM